MILHNSTEDASVLPIELTKRVRFTFLTGKPGFRVRLPGCWLRKGFACARTAGCSGRCQFSGKFRVRDQQPQQTYHRARGHEAALLPIAQGRERRADARREFVLGQAQPIARQRTSICSGVLMRPSRWRASFSAWRSSGSGCPASASMALAIFSIAMSHHLGGSV